MSHPELLKSSSNSPSPRPKESITGVVMVMESKITITTPVKRDLSHVRKIRDDS
jgi:hypothetical protein